MADREKIYSLNRFGAFLGVARRVLPNAVAPYAPLLAKDAYSTASVSAISADTIASVLQREGSPEEAAAVTTEPSEDSSADAGLETESEKSKAAKADLAKAQQPGEFGWIRGAFEAPFPRDDHYIVEFLDKDDVRILAYLDQFGRVFTMDSPTHMPPARDPDLMLARVSGSSDEEGEHGRVLMKGGEGTMLQVARYHFRKNRYTVDLTWYDFGNQGKDLSYADFMTRLYCAFVYRPSITGSLMPAIGLESIQDLLGVTNIVRGLRAVKLLVSKAEEDPALMPPALARLLVRWLDEAGFTDRVSRSWLVGSIGEDSIGPLRLIRTQHYADTYYLSTIDEQPVVPEETLWGIESALNRYLLIREHLGDQAALASVEECLRWDSYLRQTIALQAPDASQPADAQADGEDGPAAMAGEWDVRESIGEFMEKLRLPYRFSAIYHCDVRSGLVAFLLTAPGPNLMPREELGENGVEITSSIHRYAEALTYSQHLGMALASSAFAASKQIRRVSVTALPQGFDEHADEEPLRLGYYSVIFTRHGFCDREVYEDAAKGDPNAFFTMFGARYGASACSTDPFFAIVDLPSYHKRVDLPELSQRRFSVANAKALGASTSDGLRISYDADVRKMARGLASEIVVTESVQEATRIILKKQKETGSPLVYEACTRLMTALTQGTLRIDDRLGIIDCFIGESAYGQAAKKARELVSTNPREAAQVLREVIGEAEASGRFRDTPEAVHRMFDSYASRVVYNLSGMDAHKKVELIPPALFLCYFDALNLLDESFTQSEEAVEYGKRCIELAPMFTPAYRRCARAYMLVGDLESASALLIRALKTALSADEIATAYYQLAYVQWRSGNPRLGIACYLKSIMTSTIYAGQASIELHELLREGGADLMERVEVDGVLEEGGIPLAPSSELLEKLELAMHAAVDEELFSVARSLLSVCAHYRPDDALANIMHSLEDPLADNRGGSSVDSLQFLM